MSKAHDLVVDQRLPAGERLDDRKSVLADTNMAPVVRSRNRVVAAGPGVAVSLAGGVGALALNVMLPPVSALLIALILGVAFAGFGGVRQSLSAGLAVASRRILRIGVALLGLQLVVGQLLALGWEVMVVALVVVVGGIAFTVWAGAVLGVPPARRLLIACGFSICGAAAVAAVDGVTESDEEDMAVALAMVVTFGSAAMLILPFIALRMGFAERAAGAWMGGSIHEVGQVVVAGGLIGGSALQVAVVVKLARVLMLAPVLTVVSWRARARAVASASRPPARVPLFVAMFVALAVVGSVVSVPQGVRDGVAVVQSLALAAAMFALGCGINARALRRLRRAEVALGFASSAMIALLAMPAVILLS